MTTVEDAIKDVIDFPMTALRRSLDRMTEKHEEDCFRGPIKPTQLRAVNVWNRAMEFAPEKPRA